MFLSTDVDLDFEIKQLDFKRNSKSCITSHHGTVCRAKVLCGRECRKYSQCRRKEKVMLGDTCGKEKSQGSNILEEDISSKKTGKTPRTRMEELVQQVFFRTL